MALRRLPIFGRTPRSCENSLIKRTQCIFLDVAGTKLSESLSTHSIIKFFFAKQILFPKPLLRRFPLKSGLFGSDIVLDYRLKIYIV